MERVGVRELRQNLSVHLRRIAEGETLEVTDRGRPVALLSPLPGALNGPVARLVEQGRLVRPALAGSAGLPTPLPAGEGASLSELLDAARTDQR
jgi:antitoxin (DNA-binding transcriptional repressor) of toxin-antitoxin stability system